MQKFRMYVSDDYFEHSPSGQGTGVLGKAEANGRIVGSIAIVGHSEKRWVRFRAHNKAKMSAVTILRSSEICDLGQVVGTTFE
ncbi:MAG: hypothetical protein ABSF09_05030 [Candidatus Bathyarchaeia archaeon]